MNICRTTGHPLVALASTKVERRGTRKGTITWVQLVSVHSVHMKAWRGVVPWMGIIRGKVRLMSN